MNRLFDGHNAVVLLLQFIANLVLGHAVDKNDLSISVVGAEIGLNEASKGLRSPFEGDAGLMRHVKNGAVVDADHVGVRAGHQVERKQLGVRVSAKRLACAADPELRGNDAVVTHDRLPVFSLLGVEAAWPISAMQQP